MSLEEPRLSRKSKICLAAASDSISHLCDDSVPSNFRSFEKIMRCKYASRISMWKVVVHIQSYLVANAWLVITAPHNTSIYQVYYRYFETALVHTKVILYIMILDYALLLWSDILDFYIHFDAENQWHYSFVNSYKNGQQDAPSLPYIQSCDEIIT